MSCCVYISYRDIKENLPLSPSTTLHTHRDNHSPKPQNTNTTEFQTPRRASRIPSARDIRTHLHAAAKPEPKPRQTDGTKDSALPSRKPNQDHPPLYLSILGGGVVGRVIGLVVRNGLPLRGGALLRHIGVHLGTAGGGSARCHRAELRDGRISAGVVP